MKRPSAVRIAVASLLLVLSAAACAPVYQSSTPSRTYMGFYVGVQNAPPPPRLYFRSEPRLTVVVASGVRVIDAPEPDCDMFLYGGTYYLYASGYWYRSSRYDGSFRAIEPHRVPRAVLNVPARHWRNHPGNNGRGRWRNDDRGRWRD